MKERSQLNQSPLPPIRNIPADETPVLSTTSPKQQFGFKTSQLLALAVIFLGLGFIVGQKYQSQQSTSAQPAVNTVVNTEVNTEVNVLSVKTIAIEPIESYQTYQTYTGEVAALRTSEVGFERGGKLISVLVEEGDRVAVGTPLAKLDTSNLEAQRQSLVAQKAQAQARLTELNNGARSEQVAAAQATVRDLEQQLELEELRRDRREYLYQEGAIAKEQLDEIAFNSKALTERLANAKSNLNELQNGTRVEQIAAQQAAVDRLTAEIRDLDITIAKSILKSPFEGIVSVRNLDEGTVIEAGRSVLRLVENTQPKVKIGVPITVAQKIQPGSQQQVKIGNKNYSAIVDSILPEVNPATRTRSVVLKLTPAAASKVAPGEIARLTLTTTKAIDGYWLPITALIKGEKGLWSCFAVVNNDHNTSVDRRYIELLETQEDKVLVRGTLQPGDKIVADGTHRLVPGQLVSIDN